jgi:hypothetical protein
MNSNRTTLHRIIWRKILPSAQLALYLLLIWYGCPYWQTWQNRLGHWMMPTSVGAHEFDMAWIDGPLSSAEQLALGINAPMTLAALVILIPFESLFHDGASRALAMYTITALSIPILWYLIGRRLETRTIVRAHFSKARKILTVWGLASAALLLALQIADALIFRFGEMLVGRLLILGWSITGILVFSQSIRHWKLKVVNEP